MPDPENIEIRKLKNVDLKGGIVVDGFPSIGLANAIASECLIHSLKTEFVAAIDSPSFPPLSIIKNAMPNFPARVYANEELKLAMFVSELNLDPVMFRPVANMMIDWAVDSNGSLLISAAGIPYEDGRDEEKKAGQPQVYAVGSTPSALKKAAEAGIPPVPNGSVAGIPAILLNEGAWRNYDVIVLMVKVVRDMPDFRAGAAVAEALARLAPGASCDIPALLKEAESMEKTLKKIHSDQQQATLPKEPFYG
ncbi:MAG TPA: PAC2 family protein [Nitrososphaera sp.]|nr:PAC2 family protein [Nitrososphaera sp.]